MQPQEDGGRLDQLVARHCGMSRRVARTLIAAGCVHVNKRVVRILTRPVRGGARVYVARPDAPAPAPVSDKPGVRDATGMRGAARRRGAADPAGAAAAVRHDRPDVEILHLDRWMVVVNKPARLLSETDRFGSPSLESVVPGMLRARGERSDVWLVHRLDAGTSGVLVMARSSKAARMLGECFREAVVRKRYLALCQGAFTKARVVDAPLARQRGVKHGVSSAGKAARTAVEPLVQGEGATLVRARPTTGRTHQIRVHMMHVGHPLLGDRLYGGPGFTAGRPPQPIARAMLHAERLVLPHPHKGATMTFEAPPPEDFLTTARAFGIEMPKA